MERFRIMHGGRAVTIWADDELQAHRWVAGIIPSPYADGTPPKGRKVRAERYGQLADIQEQIIRLLRDG